MNWKQLTTSELIATRGNKVFRLHAEKMQRHAPPSRGLKDEPFTLLCYQLYVKDKGALSFSCLPYTFIVREETGRRLFGGPNDLVWMIHHTDAVRESVDGKLWVTVTGYTKSGEELRVMIDPKSSTPHDRDMIVANLYTFPEGTSFDKVVQPDIAGITAKATEIINLIF
jgi:hypothetical protein